MSGGLGARPTKDGINVIGFPPGGRLVLETPGGGGCGDPAGRLQAARDEDRKNGYTG